MFNVLFSVSLWISVSLWWIICENTHHRDTEIAQRHRAIYLLAQTKYAGTPNNIIPKLIALFSGNL